MNEVVDSRLLIEHLYTAESETKNKTSRKLRELAQRSEGLIPTIVIAEVVQVVCEKAGREEAETCYLSLVRSGLQIQGVDQEIAKQAGLLKCRYRNIPMGDCLIASTAMVRRARVLSDDTHFDIIKEVKRTWI